MGWPVRANGDVLVASTMFASAGITSAHCRVFNPQALWRDVTAGFLHHTHHAVYRGDIGAVDVVHAGADSIGVSKFAERFQQLQLFDVDRYLGLVH